MVGRIRLLSSLYLLSKCLWKGQEQAKQQVYAFHPTVVSFSRRLPNRVTPLTAAAAAFPNQDGEKKSQRFSPDKNSRLSNFRYHAGRRKQQRDVVIVGGALAGLSTALYLAEMDPNRHITILDREEYGNPESSSPNAQPASFAAAGMLAPQSERLPPGQLLDLCVSSRRMFPEFCDLVETLAQESGDEGAPYLFDNQFRRKDDNQNSNLNPWNVGYVGSGGFLAPAFAGDAVATWAPPEDSGSAMWLDATQARELEPCLHPEVVGGWWFPDDASVDARRLTCSLRAACVAAGVQILSGPQYEVSSLDLVDGKCQGMWLQPSKNNTGQRYICANTVLIANGAWMRNLLPVPIEPHKGQSLSLRMPMDRPPILRRVLFAQDSYIVPKADGRIVIGATVEAGSYDPNVTPAGLMHIMTHALQLVPELKDLPVEETWVGLRPTTPDKGPILGKSPWQNLFVAGGYWRNGVLLAPKTGQLLASLIISSRSDSQVSLSPEDSAFLEAFAWDRFTNAAKSKALAANSRYAASMHPIHRRSSTGVSAAVGTELGSYSSARAAADERKKDRDSLWQIDTSDDNNEAFERAAAMGKEDAAAYTFGDTEANKIPKDESSLLHEPQTSNGKSEISNIPSYFEGSVDAITVGTATESDETAELSDVYKAIQENKERNSAQLNDSISEDDDDDDERPDPGFRIYHVDPETGKERMVPPYTSPGEFQTMLDKKRTDNDSKASSSLATEPSPASEGPSDELSSVYKAIQENKAKQNVVLEDNNDEEERPDPGFRIYHVDSVTGESREVPPYTSPGDFLASIAASADKDSGSSQTTDLTVTTNNGETSNGDDSSSSSYSETTFDGYQDIQQSNARDTRQEELEVMREVRRRNRLGQEQIDPSEIGAQRMKHDDDAN